jgi:glycosyltransferase involved in cell wall biosynthesis
LVTTGEALREQLMRQAGVRRENTLSIPTGIATERFDPAKIDRTVLRREWNVADDEHLIGTIAMLRSWKGHPVLIDAMPAILARHPRTRFVFIGHSTEGDRANNEFVQRAKNLGVEGRLLFAGYRTDIPQVLAALDMVVLPSTKNEGVPQSLSQSLCMAKPVVATSVGAVGEIVRHQQTGLLVPPSDPLALGQAIISQLDQPEQARAWGEAGRQLILSEYGIGSMAAKTERLYHRLLSGQPAWPDHVS